MGAKHILGYSIAVLLCGIVFGLMVSKAWDATDQADCYKWARWARQYPAFYLTPNQADQCKYWNIAVVAPVKVTTD